MSKISIKYILWVGGCIMYEGSKKSAAERTKQKFLDLGYDDVALEIINL